MKVRIRGIDIEYRWQALSLYHRRTEHPSQFNTKLRPYLTYYSSTKPRDDHGDYPVLLAVLRDELVETQFLATATNRPPPQGTGRLHVLASHTALLDALGPLAAIWRQRPGGVRKGL